ncbi:MAG: hypothetical protein B1H03_02980 [Planctomycetales bacterium 4484_113]|nr:MAG: hypothetical protein B1H03_02980 [Planctomycetales bacterium 4484_113]
MKILITGGAGFIGSHLAEAVLADGNEVLVIDNLSTGKREFVPAGAILLQMDVRDAAFVDAVIGQKPDLVYHLAAQISVAESTRDPRSDAAANIDGTLAVLAATERAGARGLVNISTATVYAHDSKLPWHEESRKGPLAPYAIAKLACEHYAHHYAVFHRLPTLTFRLSNVYGPRQNPLGEAGVIAIFLRQMLLGEEVQIHGDGEQAKDFIFVADVVRALASVAKEDFPQAASYEERAVNLGSGEAHSVNEIFSQLRGLTGYRREAEHVAPRPADQPRMVLDAERARRWLGWKPEVKWEEGLSRTCEWFRKEGGAFG